MQMSTSSPSQVVMLLGVILMLAGLSVEASLEMIAYHEAEVARVTTSNTKSMNNPLYHGIVVLNHK